MPQSSAPIVDVNISDVDWRDAFGDEAGVLSDYDGSAYRVVLPPDSDVVRVGSPTQRSVARVGGFVHRIPAGESEPITVPGTTGSTITSIIALRYDPAYTGELGPVRLVLLPGTSAGLPNYDDAPPGPEELPLWAITRQAGQALSQAKVVRLFTRIAPSMGQSVEAPMPLSAPLDTRLRRGGIDYIRELDQGIPTWTPLQYIQRDAPANAAEGAFWYQVS